jgi:hypothetical protein
LAAAMGGCSPSLKRKSKPQKRSPRVKWGLLLK